ncbi:MAG: NERD domain-containing protein [Clostridia bacterium]|nr:NERD domain-containing protein [Clostridia bacterium]
MENLTQKNEPNIHLDCLYTKNEYINELYKTQQKMANLVCMNMQNEKVCFHNIMEKLSQIAKNGGAINEFKFESCKKQGDILDHQLTQNAFKNRLIKKVITELDKTERTKMVLKNLTFDNQNDIVNIDLVVITSSMILVLELKNTECNIRIDETGRYYKTNASGKNKFDKNIYDDLCKKSSAIKKALSINRYDNLPIIPYLVFLNTGIEVSNDCENIQSCYIDEIVKVIDEDERESVILYNQMQNIVNQLKFQNNYLAQASDVYNLMELKNNFAELLMKLNLSSENEIFQFLYSNNIAA